MELCYFFSDKAWPKMLHMKFRILTPQAQLDLYHMDLKFINIYIVHKKGRKNIIVLHMQCLHHGI